MTIPIQNLYYLLCYAWDTLEEGGIVKVSQEECETPDELFAYVLHSGVVHLLKRGVDRGYITESEDTSSLRGKLDLSATIKRDLLSRSRVHCHVDSLSYDVTHNRIIKTTIGRLVRCAEWDKDLRNKLMNVYRRLHQISDIDLTPKVFSSVRLHRNNAFYGFLLHVCRVIHDNLIVNQQTGTTTFRDFLRNERQMAVVFEKFVRNFYSRNQDAFRVKVQRFDWQNVEASDEHLRYLPSMKTDTSLLSKDRNIVIDTKYYADALQSYYDSESIHSGNLYQLFSYLKNLSLKSDGCHWEGMLLYPTTGKTLDLDYRIQGHRLRIATIDLNADWKDIRQRLLGFIQNDAIASVL